MQTRPIKRLKSMAMVAAGAAVLLGVGAFATSCGDDDGGGSTSGKAVDEVTAALNEELEGEKNGDADKYLKHVTDKWLKAVGGYTREEAKADPSKFQSDDLPTIKKVTVSGSKATIEIGLGENGFDYNAYVLAVKQGGEWKIDELHVKSAGTIPAGAKTVNLDLTDFAFGFTRKDITSKNVTVLRVENKGKQPHMVILEKLPEKGDLQELLKQENPQGVEQVGGAFLFSPGDKADVVIKEKLAPGRYAFLCFVADQDDKEHTPHAFKGMATDFTVE